MFLVDEMTSIHGDCGEGILDIFEVGLGFYYTKYYGRIITAFH